MFWKTKSGQILDIKDMSESHLKNSIAMLRRILANDPGEQYYMGDSVYAEEAVAMENAHNEQVRKDLHTTLVRLQRELDSRVTP
jgi:hypothetical protein